MKNKMIGYLVREEAMRELVNGYLKYLALCNGGVDNWEWYGESLGAFTEEASFQDQVVYEDFEEIVEKYLLAFKKTECEGI